MPTCTYLQHLPKIFNMPFNQTQTLSLYPNLPLRLNLTFERVCMFIPFGLIFANFRTNFKCIPFIFHWISALWTFRGSHLLGIFQLIPFLCCLRVKQDVAPCADFALNWKHKFDIHTLIRVNQFYCCILIRIYVSYIVLSVSFRVNFVSVRLVVQFLYGRTRWSYGRNCFTSWDWVTCNIVQLMKVG